jgi:hypothetical protein
VRDDGPLIYKSSSRKIEITNQGGETERAADIRSNECEKLSGKKCLKKKRMGKKRKKKNYRFRDDCFYIGPLKEEEEEGVCLIFGSFVVTHHTSLYRIQMSKPHRRRRRKKILKEACHFDPMHFTLRIKFDFFLLSISFISM